MNDFKNIVKIFGFILVGLIALGLIIPMFSLGFLLLGLLFKAALIVLFLYICYKVGHYIINKLK